MGMSYEFFPEGADGRKVRVFSLSETFVDDYKDIKPAWGPTGYFTFKRTYARTKPDGTTEEWWETCRRVIEGTFNVQKIHCRKLGLPWNEPKAQKSAQEMYDRMFAFKWTPPGRGLWTMGTDIVYEKGSACLNNCAFVSTKDIDTDFAAPFTFLMDMSMLGVGVGGDCKGAGKVKIQQPRMRVEPYVVEDSREGWVELIRTVLNSFVGKGYYPKNIDWSQVRPEGTPIKGFGGVASGPQPMVELVNDLTELLMPKKEGETYRIGTSQIVDIFNMVGKCVVAGGVRRTAEIMFGDPDDMEFRSLKDPSELNRLCMEQANHEQGSVEWTALQDQIANHPLRTHRWASNNSIFGTVGMDYSKLTDAIAANGEPGIVWLDAMRGYGRMKDPRNDKDHRVMGSNPCFAGDSLIAVADGRGAVSIKQLVDEGNDVPVYSLTPEGKVEIKMGRNPRMTRESSQLVEITLDDGSTLRVTPDHKMLLLDGSRCHAKDLQAGDSLPRFSKFQQAIKHGGNEYWRVATNTKAPQAAGSRVYEHKLISQFNEPDVWASVYDEAKASGWHKGGLVVHHKDYNPLNNAPDNLQVMTFRDHTTLHGSVDNNGENNPMWGRSHTEATKRKIGKKTVERCSDPVFLAKLAASHKEAERQEASERLSERRKAEFQEYYKEQLEKTDLDTVWMEGRLHAVRNCEVCDDEFVTSWGKRGRSYCSIACANKSVESIAARKAGQKVAFADKQRQTLHLQVQAYKDLQESLGREPWKKEWEQACRETGTPFRIRYAGTTENPYALNSFGHLKEVAGDYNHRVKSVRFLSVEEPVYNLSVDVNHTLCVVTNNGDHRLDGIFAANCSEQSLESYELCCLVETFPAHHDSLEDYQRTLKMAYLYAKSVTLIPTHDQRTNAVMMRNRRIGCSQSGIIQAINKLGRREYLRWCDKGYNYIQSLDNTYSDWLCVPASKKTTSVKPSGTVSLLCGATPGIHYPHSEYYIRNIRLMKTSPLVQSCKDAGYPIEECAYQPGSLVVSFPVHEQHFSKAKNDVTIWEQFANAADLQRHWADNQVSITVTFKQAEAEDIATCLSVYEDQLKSISLLPLSEHGYVQAPYIEITKDEYEAMSSKITALNLNQAQHEADDKFCDGDTCTVDFGSN